MRERLLDNFDLRQASPTSLSLVNKRNYTFDIDVQQVSPHLRDIWHVRVAGPDRELGLNSFFPADSNHVSNDRSTESDPTLSTGEKAFTDLKRTLHGKQTSATVQWDTSPIITISDDATGQRLHSDLPNRSYNLTAHGIRHYSRLEDRTKDLHLGLGEQSGPLNLTGRRFEIKTSDSASYDPFNSDINYKHTPFLIRVPHPNSGNRLCTAYYSTSHADSVWDLGKSIDEPWGAYKAFEVETGALDYYIFTGSLQEVIVSLSKLIEKSSGVASVLEIPTMPPRWALGYISSPQGLGPCDDPSLQSMSEDFLQKLADNGISCSAMQLTSSYTVTEGEKGLARNVFTLNTKRMPDFQGFCRKAHQRGIRIVPNIKPYINKYHPDYQALSEAGALFLDPDTGESVKTWIWSMGIGEQLEGGWIDTSSKAGFDYWYKGVSKLIEMGCDGIWNDNDEYSLHDDGYLAAWDLPGLPGRDGKPKDIGRSGRTFFTELLGKASHDALRHNAPGRRPYVLTRSANINTMQYCCSTWSGDNTSDWAALKGNVVMTINSSLSLYHSYGSDVGGFAGLLPDAELFTRWCQVMAYHTRFCINSIHVNPLNSDQFSVNSPWQHEETLSLVRNAIKRRYELLPYMYALHHESRTDKTPPVAPFFWGPFARDEKLYDPEIMSHGDFWLGCGRLLVAGVFKDGQRSRQIYLPRSSNTDEEIYFSLCSKQGPWTAGGVIAVDTPLSCIAVLARSGSLIPVGKPCSTITARSSMTCNMNDGTPVEKVPGLIELDDWRGIEIFPHPTADSHYNGRWLEDDGESQWPCPVAEIVVSYWSDHKNITVQAIWQKRDFVPLWRTLWVIVP